MTDIVETIREVRDHIAEVVDRVEREDTPTYITRRGRRVAAIVPLEFVDAYYLQLRNELQEYMSDNPSDEPDSLTAVIAQTLARDE